MKKDTIKGRMATHGMSNTREYIVWKGIKKRCSNKNDKGYKNYGGRGIKVCSSWMKFENFFSDMGYRPSSKYSIDRIDNNKGYYKENCKWSTRITQQNNTRANHFLIYKGERKTMANWASKMGIKYNTLKRRIYRGWSVERALNN